MHGGPRSQVRSRAARPGAPEFQSHERPVILVVDDDDGVRDALHVILDDSYSV
jgi:hypothetical protein